MKTPLPLLGGLLMLAAAPWCAAAPASTPVAPDHPGLVLTQAQFQALLPQHDPFYTRAGLQAARRAYPAFARTGSAATQAREMAAFLAMAAFETGGLRAVKEQNPANYAKKCDPTRSYGCPAGRAAYYGRGPIMLSWNFNYKHAGDALGIDLLHHPERVETDAAIAWKSALWYWMTQAGPGRMSSHQAMVSGAGFGQVINAFNGTLECHGANPASVRQRGAIYTRFVHLLGATPGAPIDC